MNDPTAHDKSFLRVTLERDEAREALAEVIAVLDSLKRGGCYCDIGIGHPMMKNHTPQCIQARALLERIKNG